MENKMLAQILVTALVFLALSFVKADEDHPLSETRMNFALAAFFRPCSSHNDCEFKSSIGTIYLTCENLQCKCKTLDNFYHPIDTSRHEVFEITNKGFLNCQVEDGSPCGHDNGMIIDCQSDASCIVGKCRHTTTIAGTPQGWACDDDLDCKTGLTCQQPFNPFQSKSCEPPTTWPSWNIGGGFQIW